MSNYQRLLVSRTQVADGAIYSSKLGLSVQTGTGTPAVAIGYISFTTAFGTPPAVEVTPGTQIAAAAIGSGNMISVVRVSKGSFAWRGTPLKRANWRAVGYLDTQNP